MLILALAAAVVAPDSRIITDPTAEGHAFHTARLCLALLEGDVITGLRQYSAQHRLTDPEARQLARECELVGWADILAKRKSAAPPR
jgi:hypothetical protein